MSLVKKDPNLATNQASVNQWIAEIPTKRPFLQTTSGYTGESKIRPVTVATYQIITYRRSKILNSNTFTSLMMKIRD